jgi:hypothetical protein
MQRYQRFEIVFPNRVAALVAIRRPITGLILKIGNGNAIYPERPGNLRDHLLCKGEEPDVPFANNVKPHGSCGGIR